MGTIDVINKLNLPDEKKLKLLALYVDSLLILRPVLRDTDLQDFIEDVFNEDEQPAGTVGVTGPPGEQGEPGIPDEEAIKTRYDELLEPLEDLGSLGAVPEDGDLVRGVIIDESRRPLGEEGRLVGFRDSLEADHLILEISMSQEARDEWITIMQRPDDPELPPPGTTICSLRRRLGDDDSLQLGVALVSAEGGPFIDVYLEKGEDIACEYKPIRDTEFLEGRTSINMQYDDQTYELEIKTADLSTVVE